MRVLLLADVHANWDALLAVQRAEPQPDAVLFAGDAVGYGPDPAPCVRWLLAHATLAVRGNHDEALITQQRAGVPAELEDAAAETLAYARRIVPESDRERLSRWPVSASMALGGARFHAVHGTPVDPLRGELNPATCSAPELHALFDPIAADIILLGHTHVPAIRQLDDRLIVNPGSLGQPRYGVPDATYAVWEDGHLQIRHLHYDHAAPARKLRLTPLSPEVIEQLSDILETGLS
ncbi:MAG TPA: YfcE family phosphodiesterase [Anaerolineae bacterium]|nr:YfcE family phosphodiesterase [Anaerolineae bacterium]